MENEKHNQNQENKIDKPVELKEHKNTILNEDLLDILMDTCQIKFPNLVIKSKYTIDGITYIITGIDNKLFKHCKFIKTLVIEDGIEQIEEEAFKKCKRLESINMPNSINTISKNAFEDCEKLQKITTTNQKYSNSNELPNNIKKIGKEAFKNCTSLKELHVESTTTKIAENAFEGIDHIYYKGTAKGFPWGATNHHTEF